jgi:hypothetical protein
MTATIAALEIERSEKLGDLLGAVDAVILALDNPTVFEVMDAIKSLRQARDAYNRVSSMYLDALLMRSAS